MSTVILDSSALIALLNKEKGWEVIADVLPNSIMCSVNVAEVAKFLMDNKGYSKDQAKEVIEHIIDEIVDFSTEQAFVTAELYSQTKKAGLSLGDRACLGLSMSTRYSVYTADKAWTSLALSINIKCIR